MSERVRRMFLVGYPRSGTTLLQTLLAAHPQMLTLPETFFFARLECRNRVLRAGGVPRRDASARLLGLRRYGIEVQRPALVDRFGVGGTGRLATEFVSSLDRAVTRQGKSAWLEKTPMHLHRISTIQQHVSGAVFIHIVREPVPAITSLYAVTGAYPERWGGVRSLDECAGRWRDDLRESGRWATKPNHIYVSYERLTADSAGVLSALVARLGLDGGGAMVARMLDEYKDSVRAVVDDEPWKSGVGAVINNRNSARVSTLLSDAELAHLTRLVEPDRDLFGSLPFL